MMRMGGSVPHTVPGLERAAHLHALPAGRRDVQLQPGADEVAGGKHCKRREPPPRPGMMLHRDGSAHEWVPDAPGPAGEGVGAAGDHGDGCGELSAWHDPRLVGRCAADGQAIAESLADAA